MSLSGTYPVRCGDNGSAGTLTVNDAGLRATFILTAEPSRDVLRLVCFCRGKAVSLGVPIPMNGTLSITRSFTRRELEKMGLVSVDSVSLIPVGDPIPSPAAKTDPAAVSSPAPPIVPTAENPDPALSGWQRESEPWRHFRDEETRELCRGVNGALYCTEDEKTLLAVPVSETAPFPLSGFLCYAEPRDISGTRYAVFTIENGEAV